MTTTTAKTWFEADKEGLGEQVARRSPAFAIFELFQNAADEASTNIEITLGKEKSEPQAVLTCTDDSPEGFTDLSDAYTLFRRSKKASTATLRGRFNSGEKYVLSRCVEASITSTTGMVLFNKDGTRSTSRHRTQAGTVFWARIRFSRDDIEEAVRLGRTILVPSGVTFILNGEKVPYREPLRSFEVKGLQTEVDFRPTRRNTIVNIHEPLPGETPMIYELGIPVVEHDGRFHVDVQARVPLNTDRDNVTPAYLRALRVAVLENTSDMLDVEDANSVWVKDALPEVSPEVAGAVFVQRFGEKTVIFDPSDQEANKRAADQGYTIIQGRSLSKHEWAALKRSDTFLPAGQVLPTGINFSPGGTPPVPENEWTPGMNTLLGLDGDG